MPMNLDITALTFLIITIFISIGVSLGVRYLLKKGSRRWRRDYRRHSPPSEAQKFNMPQSRRDQPQRKIRSATKPTPTLEEKYADAQTLEALALREIHQAQILRSTGKITEYYEAISNAIKKYISEKYGVKNVDTTTTTSTSRILENLPQDLTAGVVDDVGEILRICDMAKLRRHRPSRADLDHIFAIAKEFIEKNIMRPQDDNQNDAQNEVNEPEDVDKLFRRYM